MGVSNSKTEPCEPLRLCKQRKHYMKQAIDSRCNLAASHVVYIQSLHNLGIAIGKLAETEVSVHSSSPSSPTHIATNCNTNQSTINNNSKDYVDNDESSPLPPSQPPRFSWDYFDPTDGSFRLMNHVRFVTCLEPVKQSQIGDGDDDFVGSDSISETTRIKQCDSIGETAQIEQCDSKDFDSRIKKIGDSFFRCSKSGNEVSRMLEANQIQISYSEMNGGSIGSSSFLRTCFRGENTLVLHEPQQTTKVITWKRSMSSNSSLLCLPGPPSNHDNENNFIEELCMIAGSHSSTLDRMYAWERKLYDEVKASESIRNEYDRKCDELRHQFAKDLKPHLIDKTRAMAKDLHSRLKVALHTVDSISKRIEKLRDEELQPQLMELIQGLMRMWKAMLECHHAQHITSSYSNHHAQHITSRYSKNSRTQSWTTNHIIMVDLELDVVRLGSSFSDLVKSYISYVESINSWLQNCITQPKERVKGRRAFSPRRAVAPPIFVMCRDWSAGIRTLHSQKVSDVIKELLCHIRRISIGEEMKNKELSLIENGEEKKIRGWDLSMIDGGLTKVFDRLTDYCEESWKMYEVIKEKTETAGNLYSNYRAPPRPSII